MIISFDLDDTLIPGIKKFETEKRSIFQKLCGITKIRLGTVELMKSLKLQGHQIYIYTTSLRPASRIWYTFYTYGIRLDKVINQKKHEAVLQAQSNYILNTHLLLTLTYILMTPWELKLREIVSILKQ